LGQQTHFEPSQVLLFALIGVSNERLHGDTTADGIDQGLLDLDPIESKNENADTLFGFFKSLDDGLDAVIRLNEQLHSVSPWERCNRYVINKMQFKDQRMFGHPVAAIRASK